MLFIYMPYKVEDTSWEGPDASPFDEYFLAQLE